MANQNDLASYTQRDLDYWKLATVTCTLAATGNAVANLAIMGGGVSGTGGCYAVRRVTAINLGMGNIALGQVCILSSNDGVNTNAITVNSALSSLTANNTYQDLTLATGISTTLQTSSVLYVDVQTANATATSVIFDVYGHLVNP